MQRLVGSAPNALPVPVVDYYYVGIVHCGPRRKIPSYGPLLCEPS